MKKIFTSNYLILAKKQIAYEQQNELIVAYQKLSPKQIDEFNSSISSIVGIKNAGKCDIFIS